LIVSILYEKDFIHGTHKYKYTNETI